MLSLPVVAMLALTNPTLPAGRMLVSAHLHGGRAATTTALQPQVAGTRVTMMAGDKEGDKLSWIRQVYAGEGNAGPLAVLVGVLIYLGYL